MISSFLKLKEPFLPYDKKGEWSRYHLRSCSIKFLLNTSSPLTGTSRRCLPNNGFCLQHLSSKATFHTTFRGHLPADECPSLSAARCVLLFVITFDYLLSWYLRGVYLSRYKYEFCNMHVFISISTIRIDTHNKIRYCKSTNSSKRKPICEIGSANHLVHDSSCARIPEFKN